MFLPVSTIAALCVLFDYADSTRPDNDLDLVFSQRTHSDWQNAWHREKYTRCRDTLIKHLYWACEKDIYRLTRRSEDPPLNNYENDVEVTFPWIHPSRAKRMLRFRRNINKRSGPSITNECCKSSGCTWEEYAEYCPTNKRYTSYVKK